MNGPPPFDNTHAWCEIDGLRKTFKYRLYPTTQQVRLLEQQLEECRWLYNHLLAERRAAWEHRQQAIRLYDQHATLPGLKAARPALAGVHSQVLQNVAVRIDRAFKACLRRCTTGEKPGYPRFRGQGRYDSLTFPQAPVGCKLDEHTKRLRIMNVGLVKIVGQRSLEGLPKTVTLTRHSTGQWSGAFSCACAAHSPLPATGQHVGIAVGLQTFAVLSTGDAIATPRFFRKAEQALAKVQRRLSKEEQGTPERAARRKIVARVHERMAWRRGDFSHQHSRRIANPFDVMAGEDLSVNRMTHNQCLAKSIHDAAWTQFAHLLSYQAAWAGRTWVAVNPA